MTVDPISIRALVAVVVLLTAAATSAAQTPMTLAEALARARERSEAVDAARAGESRADADLLRTNSQRLPQVNFNGGYERTLASEFSDAFAAGGPICDPLIVDAARPLADRLGELERAASCGAIGPSLDFGELPFGRRNVYRFGFTFGQSLFTGGRITAERTQAELSRRSAVLTTSSAEAQLALDVTRAFYDAALSDRLLAIAESTYEQANASFDHARLAFGAGRQPEFELLRAQVARDNERPVIIRRRADREIAYLRLRQLLELPPDTPLVLDAGLEAETLAPPAPFAAALEQMRETTAIADRAPVQQAEAIVGVREAGVSVARAERLPQVSLSSSYGRVGYPASGAFPGWDDFRTNWTLGAAVSMPIFTGARIRANELAARADLARARAELEQTRELAELDAAIALQDLAAAAAAWEATAGTIQQAERAYQIAELRYREGVSTQLELNDARLALQSARANRAQSARDVQVARARAALLPSLPIQR